MQTGVRNPFEPPLEMVPLSLSLDSRSLADVDGELGDQVAYLLELCDTELIDPLVVWRRPGFREDLPTVELRDVPERGDELLVVNPGERGFVGVVRIASQYGKMADSAGLSGEDREWFVHYGIAAVGFHSRSPRHYFVTADERLLKARDEGTVPALWKRARIVSVPQALALLGRLMRMHGADVPRRRAARAAHDQHLHAVPRARDSARG